MTFKVLDLYCREGGAGAGYRQGGASLVVGVDILPIRNYPGDLFIQADVLDLDEAFIRQFDLVHASSPCQFGTELNNDKTQHINLIPPTRAKLKKAGVRYVLENVRGVARAGHLINPVSLFGTMFDLHMVTSTGQRFDLSRERCFETNWPLVAPPNPRARFPIANVFGGHLRARSGAYRTGKGTGRTRDFIGEDKPALARQLFGMPWASMTGMSEAVPPAFTRYIGEQFAAHQAQRRAA
jgi:DNA (cytosine-5)-methyltransferase 1